LFYQSHSMWNMAGKFSLVEWVYNFFFSVIIHLSWVVSRKETQTTIAQGTQSLSTPLIKRVTSLVPVTYNFKIRLIYRLYYVRLLWQNCHNSNQLFQSLLSPRLCTCMISSGNGVGVIPNISVFQVKLKVLNTHLLSGRWYKRPKWGYNVNRIFHPIKGRKVVMVYTASPDVCTYTTVLAVKHGRNLSNV
jgi:hypothetical protein